MDRNNFKSKFWRTKWLRIVAEIAAPFLHVDVWSSRLKCTEGPERAGKMLSSGSVTQVYPGRWKTRICNLSRRLVGCKKDNLAWDKQIIPYLVTLVWHMPG